MPSDTYPAANITAPQPYYGTTEDRCPGVIFLAPNNSLRIVLDRDFDGRWAWHIQTRASATIHGATWTTQNRARRKAGLVSILGSHLGQDRQLASFVARLGDKPMDPVAD